MSKAEDFDIEEGFYGMPSLYEYRGTDADVVIPEEVWEIEGGAFENCPALETVRLPRTLNAIRQGAFWECRKLRQVIFPETPAERIEIEPEAFFDCPLLERENPLLIAGGEVLAYLGSDAEVVIPEGVRSLRDGVFQENDEVNTVILPGTLERIGDCAFRNCSHLRRINFPGRLREIGAEAFAFCLELESAALPEGLEKLGEQAFFSCEELSWVRLPQCLRTIPRGCFTWCSELEHIHFPPLLASVEDLAFAFCFRLRVTELPPRLQTIGARAFDNCNWERVPYLLLPEPLKEVGDWFGLAERRRRGEDAPPPFVAAPPLIAPHLPFSAFPEDYRLYALKGLAVSRTLGVGLRYPPETERDFLAYARANRQELLKEVMKDEALWDLLSEELILCLT